MGKISPDRRLDLALPLLGIFPSRRCYLSCNCTLLFIELCHQSDLQSSPTGRSTQIRDIERDRDWFVGVLPSPCAAHLQGSPSATARCRLQGDVAGVLPSLYPLTYRAPRQPLLPRIAAGDARRCAPQLGRERNERERER